MLMHELHEQTELGSVHRLLHIGSAHMVNHHGGGQCGEEVPQLGQVHCLKINDHMPAPGFDALGDFHQFVFGREVDQTLHEIKTYPPHTSIVHVLQGLVGHVPLDGRHTTRSAL